MDMLAVCEPPTALELERLRLGDPVAIEGLLRRELPSLERFVGRLVGPGVDIEDLVQITLIRATAALPRFRGEAPVRLWLERIATRVVLDHFRGPGRRRRAELRVVAPEPEAPDAPPDRVLDARAKLRRVAALLDTLPPKNRAAFVLHVLDGRPVAEVAALMGASRVTTRSRVFLARRALAFRASRDAVLKDHFEDPEGGAR